MLTIHHAEKAKLPLGKIGEKDAAVIALINRYYARALAAKRYAARPEGA